MAYKVKKAKARKEKEIVASNAFVYAFNERGNLNEVKDSDLWKLHNKAIFHTEDLTREEKDNIFRQLQNSSFGGGTRVALLGVMFNFSPILKKFYVERNYGGVDIVYAIDKTSIRNDGKGGNSVKKIQEATN